MAEESQLLKRHRQESLQQADLAVSKRQKSLHNILSILDEDEPEPSHEPSLDLSDIYTTLQRELSSDSSTFEFDPTPSTEEEAYPPPPHHHQTTEDGSTAVESVMRHLLEASDDELGIPNTEDGSTADVSSDEIVSLAFTDHGLWDIEDETANYYTFLQSELFM